MTRIKIKAAPASENTGTKRIRIKGIPDTPEMQTGGYADTGASRGYGMQQTGQGYALDRFWSSPTGYPGGTAKVNPYAKTGNTLPEAKEGGDINAEKQEMVLGDFDQDGQQELMNVNGKPHTEGGKDINVPSNSFVFSDTKALKIKDPDILAMFGMKPKRGGYTPAEIAKKYDLNKLKSILNDPNAEDFAKKSAQLMYDNYLAKLNKLASVQEAMKAAMGMEHHDPNQQQQQEAPPVQEVGNMGQGGQEMMQPDIMMKYGGIPIAQYGYTNTIPEEVQKAKEIAFNNSNSDIYGNNTYLDPNSRINARSQVLTSQVPITGDNPMDWNIIANEQVAQSVSPVYKMYPSKELYNPININSNITDASYPNVTPPLTGPITNAGSLYDKPLTKDELDQLFKTEHEKAMHNPNLVRGVDYGSDWISHKLAEPIMAAKNVPIELRSKKGYNEWVRTHGGDAANLLGTGKYADRWGIRDTRFTPPFVLNPTMDPWSNPHETPAIPGQVEPSPEDDYFKLVPYAKTSGSPIGTTEGDTQRKKILQELHKKKGKGFGFQMNPNFLGDAMNLMQMAQLRKFRPYEPVPQAVIPDTVFLDPTRAIAAQQEAARIAMETAAGSAVGPIGRAIGASIQGEAGKQAFDTIGQYANQNVQIANAANQQAAAITNELMSKQANRLAELNKAGFLADRDYQREMGRLQAEYTDRLQKHHEDAVKTAWLNKTSEYFDIGPGGFPVFKSEEAKNRYWKNIQGGTSPDFAARVKALTKDGYTVDQAIEIAHGEQGRTRTQYGPTGQVQKTTVSSGQYGGHQMRYGGTHMAMPEMAPAYQRNAERIPYYQIGGSYIPLSAGPDLPMYQAPVAVDSAYMQPAPVEKVSRKKGEDIATTTNNPGNIIFTPKIGRMFNAIDSGIKQTDGTGHFAAFPDLTTGFAAYQTQLFGDVDGIMKSKYYKADTPVHKALKIWSGGLNKDGSINNKGYGAEIYPEIKGKTLGELTMAERKELTKRQIKRESGQMYNLLRQRGVFQYGGNPLQKFMK